MSNTANAPDSSSPVSHQGTESLGKTFDIARVRSDSELGEVGKFRYQCYLEEGLIEAKADQCFLDDYDFAPNAQIYTVTMDDRIVGTIRLHVLDHKNYESATMAAFSDVLMPKIWSGMKLLDGARFAVAPDLGAVRLAVARQTLRLYANFAELNAVDYGVAAVADYRILVYHKLYGFSQISEPRQYADLSKELVLMGVDLREFKAQAIATGQGAVYPLVRGQMPH